MRNNFFAKIPFAILATVVVLFLSQAHAQLKEVLNLTTQLEVMRPEYRAVDPLSIRFSITNNSERALNVLKWNTPFDGFNANIFNASLDGKPVIYLGRVVKRGKPQPDDYMTIGANETESIEVNLAEAYAIYEAGEYSIEFNSILLDFGHDTPTKLSAKQILEPKLIRSNVITLNLLEAKEKPKLKVEAPSDDFSFKAAAFQSCSQNQKNILNTALNNAQSYSVGSQIALYLPTVSQRANATRYTTWFGTYNATRYNTVINHFQEIYDALSYQAITFHCDCDENYYAYVIPSQPYHIYLCNLFWSAPATGTDSQFGTLIHEVSHFDVVTGTDDYVYGQSGSKSLAISDPAKAINNADSHEYFAENTPQLLMIPAGLNLTFYSLLLILLTVVTYGFFQIRKRILT